MQKITVMKSQKILWNCHWEFSNALFPGIREWEFLVAWP